MLFIHALIPQKEIIKKINFLKKIIWVKNILSIYASNIKLRNLFSFQQWDFIIKLC